MPKLLKIGIVGCGAIGTSLAKTIVSDFANSAQLSGIYDIDTVKAYNLASTLKKKKAASLTLEHLIDNVDLVIEATSAGAAYNIAIKAIGLSRDVMIMSVGGILAHFSQLQSLARENKSRIFIPSGAICGIDGLKAQSLGKIRKVVLTTKKSPRSLKGITYILKKKINLDQIKEDMVLFEGDAERAIKLFPQNINVAATLSLAGIGAKNTTVKIIASPQVKRNIHEIEINSDCGNIFTRTENITHPDNPKTSYLAVLSAIATLREILMPAKIGT